MIKIVRIKDVFEEIVYNKHPYNKYIDSLSLLSTENKEKLNQYILVVLNSDFFEESLGGLIQDARLGLDQKSPPSRRKEYEKEEERISKIKADFNKILLEAELQLQSEEISVKDKTDIEGVHILLETKLKAKSEFILELYKNLINHRFIKISYEEFSSHFSENWNKKKIVWYGNIKLVISLFHILSEIDGWIASRPSQQFVYDHFCKEKQSELNIGSLESVRAVVNGACRRIPNKKNEELSALSIKGIDIVIYIIEDLEAKFPISSKEEN